MSSEKMNTRIQEFIADLRFFASGEYLHEEERDIWDAPYDIEALPHLEEILMTYLTTVEHIDQPTSSDMMSSIAQLYQQLEEFNAKWQWAVIEPEEEKEIQSLVVDIWVACGIDPSDAQSIPLLTDVDEKPLPPFPQTPQHTSTT